MSNASHVFGWLPLVWIAIIMKWDIVLTIIMILIVLDVLWYSYGVMFSKEETKPLGG